MLMCMDVHLLVCIYVLLLMCMHIFDSPVWSTQKKKPTAQQVAAHGRDANGVPHGITAVACLAVSHLSFE
jgi:hypothetical protein